MLLHRVSAGLNAGLSFNLPLADAGAGAVNTTPVAAGGSATATFSRATAATTILSTGLVANVSAGTPRSCYNGAGLYLGYLAEQASTNLVLQSENFGTTWTGINTPTRVAANKTCGTVVLDLLGDDNAAAVEGYSQTATFTGDGVKAMSVFVSQGTSTSSRFEIFDSTATAFRLIAVLTWSVGVPSIAMTTGTHLGTDALGNGVYRLRFASGAVTAANTNMVVVYPANDAASTVTLTGDLNVGGVQAENATFCTSYIPTTTGIVTRNADALTYALSGNFVDAAGSAYAEFFSLYFGNAASANARIIGDGSGGAGAPLTIAGNTAAKRAQTFDGTAATQGPNDSMTGASIKGAVSWGSAVSVVSTGLTPAAGTYDGSYNLTSIGIGTGGGVLLNGCVKNVRIWTRALSDAELVAFTS